MYSSIFNSETKTWSGLDLPLLYHPNVSVGRVVLNALHRDYNKVIQINDIDNTTLTAGQIKLNATRIALHLVEHKIKMNDCVGVIARNSKHIGAVVFASLTLGCPVNPLDPSFTATDIAHMFRLTKPRIIFIDDDLIKSLKIVLKELKSDATVVTLGRRLDGYYYIDDFLIETQCEIGFVSPTLCNAEEQVALILCTSGTTGLPKGVMLSHAQVLSKQSEFIDIHSDDMFFCMSSLYWLTGIASLIYTTIIGATRIITTEPFSPQIIFKIIEKYQVTTLITPPSHIALSLISSDVYLVDFSSVRLWITAGAALPAAHQTRLAKHLKNGVVGIVYGLSEIAGVVSYCDTIDKLNSIGKVARAMSIRIIDDNDVCCGINETGEIIIKGKYSMLGYICNPESTNMVLKNGWLYTGDIGYFDDDDFLYIIDRKKDIIKYQNYQISPTELEEFILKINGVKAVCVVGIPDPISTDLPAAVVIRWNDISADDLHDAFAVQLADYKKLRGGVYFVDAFPMTPSGKVQRKKVLEIAIAEYNKQLII